MGRVLEGTKARQATARAKGFLGRPGKKNNGHARESEIATEVRREQVRTLYLLGDNRQASNSTSAPSSMPS